MQPTWLTFATDRAAELGQDLRKREFKDQSWLGLKTRSRDATLSRHKGININELYLHTKLPASAGSPTGEVWRGKWQGNEIAAKASTAFSRCRTGWRLPLASPRQVAD